jgi:hypothetical protein
MEKGLTCTDAFGKMCEDIRAIAEELKFGSMHFPTRSNPSIIFEVHDGQIKQVELVFENKTKKYRAD